MDQHSLNSCRTLSAIRDNSVTLLQSEAAYSDGIWVPTSAHTSTLNPQYMYVNRRMCGCRWRQEGDPGARCRWTAATAGAWRTSSGTRSRRPMASTGAGCSGPSSVPTVDLLRSTEIRVRAVDSSNNMMPEK